MQPAFAQEMKEKLLMEKARVEEELSRFAHRVEKAGEETFEVDYEDIGDSSEDNAAEVANFSNNLSLESTLEKLLRDINNALKRMENNDYGLCKYCSKEIHEARLQARPTSSSCISCKKTLTQEA